jgi:hypothetical protein
MIAEECKTKKTFYICSFCDKDYKTYNSLGNHNRKFHPKDNLVKVTQNNQEIIQLKQEVTQSNQPNNNIENSEMNTFYCIHCDKSYKYKQGFSRHKKTCKSKMDEITKIQEEQKLVIEEQKKFIEQQKAHKEEQKKLIEEQKLVKLKLRLEKMDRIDSPTFNKVNKLLKERSYKNNMMMNSMNTINTNSNNGYSVVNNYNNPIFQLGTENVSSILSLDEKKLILQQKDFSLDKMVEIVHCGSKYHQFKNVVITNVKDEFAYTYNADAGFFVKSKMNDTINDLIRHRMKDIEEIYKELKDMDKVLEKGFQQLIKSFLEQMNDIRPDDKYENPDTSEKYKNMCEYKIESLKIFIYNNQDKITKDILLLIE